jgi:hypothetical protein
MRFFSSLWPNNPPITGANTCNKLSLDHCSISLEVIKNLTQDKTATGLDSMRKIMGSVKGKKKSMFTVWM